MFYSGLVVLCRPEQFEAVGEALKENKNIDVFQSDPASHRYVVVLEEESIDAEAERFKELRAMAGVADVSLVMHRSEGEEAPKADSLASPVIVEAL